MHLAKLKSFALAGFISLSIRQLAGLAGLVGTVTDTQATIGCVIAAIGFLLFRYEIRKGYHVHNQGPGGLGGPVFNGGTLVGISLLFFGVTFFKGIIVMGIFAVVFYLFNIIIKEKE